MKEHAVATITVGFFDGLHVLLLIIGSFDGLHVLLLVLIIGSFDGLHVLHVLGTFHGHVFAFVD